MWFLCPSPRSVSGVRLRRRRIRRVRPRCDSGRRRPARQGPDVGPTRALGEESRLLQGLENRPAHRGVEPREPGRLRDRPCGTRHLDEHTLDAAQRVTWRRRPIRRLRPGRAVFHADTVARSSSCECSQQHTAVTLCFARAAPSRRTRVFCNRAPRPRPPSGAA